jgi:hypothetical protein
MSVLLVPRLTAIGVSLILDAAGERGPTPELAKAVLADKSSILSFAASGGSRSTLAGEIEAAIREIASKTGFPDNTSQVARSEFDLEAAVWLGSDTRFRTGEFLRDDVWAYICTVLLPDVVTWRFPDRAMPRFRGGVRNTLQRLWNRAVVLDRGEVHDGRWDLVGALTEDAAVQIFERASIASDKAFAIGLAEGWVRMAQKIGRAAMEPVMRRATKVLRLRNEVFDLGGLTATELEAVVDSCFDFALGVTLSRSR